MVRQASCLLKASQWAWHKNHDSANVVRHRVIVPLAMPEDALKECSSCTNEFWFPLTAVQRLISD
jgi:hypothetical protein